MTSVEDKKVHEAIGKILDDKKAYNKSLNWAFNYCLNAMGMSGRDLRVQCMYILNNITHWRHPDAKEVRRVLKEYVKTGR